MIISIEQLINEKNYNFKKSIIVKKHKNLKNELTEILDNLNIIFY